MRILFLILFPCLLAAQSRVQVIPQPYNIIETLGNFTLNANTKVYYPADKKDWATATEYLTELVKGGTGFALKIQAFKQKFTKAQPNIIYLLPDEKIKSAEGYELEVTAQAVLIRARTAAGAFYGIQTLRQLFPAQINGNLGLKEVEWLAPCCKISDAPRFQYRGLHLDVARHFFTVDFIKRYIDLLAIHKLNTFHWHLTDDQGWRIEIKKYPLLQQVAAWREETLIGHYSDEPIRYDGTRYGGYYTQEEVKEVVKYAQSRFVTVMPEIELPGHATAALAAYPELGCTGGPYQVHTTWGVIEDVFCAGNDKTMTFLDDVLTEVCALFPSTYIHIGGDECPKDRWKECPKCQARMKKEGLKDEHELQSYVIKRVEKTLIKNKKKLVGWDEILEGGLAPTATVMSWRGIEGGIAAAKSGHDAIMSPGSHCYFDHYQSDPANEPLAISGFTTLEKTYAYEPIPEALTAAQAKHILGAQANVWTEYMPTEEQVEYMAYPRVCALSEVVWSDKKLRNWQSFAARIPQHFARLNAMDLNYARSFYDIGSAYAGGFVTLKSGVPSIDVRYTKDGTEPSATSTLYRAPFALNESTTIRAAAYSGTTLLSKVIKVNYAIHKASGKPYTIGRTPTQYTGGETYALTNGVSGGTKTWNNWVGLVNRDLDPIIDFGEPTTFSQVTTHFVNAKGSWIHPPKSVTIFVSDNGTDFKLLKTLEIDYESLIGTTVESVRFDVPKSKGRYLKLVAKTTGVIPEGSPGAGNGAWLFLDEVIVE